MVTLQEINISHLRKRKIIFKIALVRDMLVPWRVSCLDFLIGRGIYGMFHIFKALRDESPGLGSLKRDSLKIFRYSKGWRAAHPNVSEQNTTTSLLNYFTRTRGGAPSRSVISRIKDTPFFSRSYGAHLIGVFFQALKEIRSQRKKNMRFWILATRLDGWLVAQMSWVETSRFSWLEIAMMDPWDAFVYLLTWMAVFYMFFMVNIVEYTIQGLYGI